MDKDSIEFDSYPAGSGQKIRREPGIPTPCDSCPKCQGLVKERNPQVGKVVDLSDKNETTINLYHQVQGSREQIPMDEITLRNFGVIHQLYESYNRQYLQLIAIRPSL